MTVMCGVSQKREKRAVLQRINKDEEAKNGNVKKIT